MIIIAIIITIIILLILLVNSRTEPVVGGMEIKECDKLVPFARTITKKSRKLPYRRRRDEYKYTIHIGQRKLLLSEIEFLTAHGGDGKIIVYAGSANGTHIALLAGKLFPQFEYYLYDPSPFDPILYKYKNIHIFNELFTEETCKKWAGRNDILFISDIRTPPPGGFLGDTKKSEEWEKIIQKDMKMQMDWVINIKPQWAMLKFRLPYAPGKTKYLAGDLYFQAWPGETSTETRLWTQGLDTCVYDNTIYEQILFRHNVCTRMQHFDLKPIIGEDILKFPGLEFNYDSRAEIDILSKYLNSVGKNVNLHNLLELFNFINTLVQSPRKGSHGAFPLVPMNDNKKKKIQKAYPFEEKIKQSNAKMKRLGKKTT